MNITSVSRLPFGALLLAGALGGCGGGQPGTSPDGGHGGSMSDGGGGRNSEDGGGVNSDDSGGSNSDDAATSDDGGTGVSTSEAGSDAATHPDDSGATGMVDASDGGSVSTGIPAVKFVVYLDDWSGGYATWANKIDFSKMTYLNLAFVEATTDNNWTFVDGQSDSDVKALVAKAHAAGVKVLASLGGGGTDTTVVNQYSNPSNDDALVSNADAFLNRLGLDGADIDIEKESTNEVGNNYGTFVGKLIATLHPEGKIVTAAVAQYLAPYMNDDTLHSFDFVNIMTYSSNVSDYTGDVDFYTSQKNMAPTKLTLGIISESCQQTSVSTAQAITNMSKNYGGPMLWDLAEDPTGSSSVYAAIQGSL